MAGIKPLNSVAAKWSRVAGAAQGEYEEGVKNPRRSWAAETAKAEAAYDKGVQAAISAKRFGKGVRAAGDAKWQQNAIEKGPARYSQGVGLALEAYQTGFEPYHRALSSLVLPARGPKGDPGNINRVAIVAKTLHDIKMQKGK